MKVQPLGITMNGVPYCLSDGPILRIEVMEPPVNRIIDLRYLQYSDFDLPHPLPEHARRYQTVRHYMGSTPVRRRPATARHNSSWLNVSPRSSPRCQYKSFKEKLLFCQHLSGR
ncbi:MAG: hypothetical protein GY801_38370 [bacterium]|nr:hypothetical protein [bacterium]